MREKAVVSEPEKPSSEQLIQDINSKIRKAGLSSKLADSANPMLNLNKWEPPALELDVYISESHMEKLIVYKNDSPERVAEEFCRTYNLPDDKKNLLLNVIKDQVSKVLTCISEEDEDCAE